MSSKKRNKKYDPNKGKRLEQAKARKNQIEANEIYELEQEYVSHAVKAYIEAKEIEEQDLISRYPNATTCPYHITIGAYGYQSLAIAIILQSIQDPIAYEMAADVHLIHTYKEGDEIKTGELKTVEFRRDVPGMSYLEFHKGKADAIIPLGHGLKKKGWKGLDDEIAAEIESRPDLTDEYSIEMIQSYMKAEARFLNVGRYLEFKKVLEWVERGTAEQNLRTLWIAEQEAIEKQNHDK